MTPPTTSCGLNEGTHYHGCECRERYVASLEQENKRLRAALETLVPRKEVRAMDIKRSTTQRGFALFAFTDDYGEKCSLQKSSSAEEDAIWLGMDEGKHHGGNCFARMHLSQEQVAELLPILQHFVEHGELPLEEQP